MPSGFGLLDTALVSVPIFLMLLGLIRGAPVELASCCGCIAGVAAAWLVSCLGPVQALGQPAAPVAALVTGVVAWRLTRGLSQRLGFDTRWIDLGRGFDSFVGAVMGAARGVVFVSAACLSYAVIVVPLGLSNPIDTVSYPVFLALGSRVTSAVVEVSRPVVVTLAEQTSLPFVTLQSGAPAHVAASLAAPPLPSAALPSPPLPGSTASPPRTNGPGLAALIHVSAPDAAAAPARPLPLATYHPDIPVRSVPVSLIETHHNILHPFGSMRRGAHR